MTIRCAALLTLSAAVTLLLGACGNDVAGTASVATDGSTAATTTSAPRTTTSAPSTPKTTTTTTTPPAKVAPSDYAGEVSGVYYFTTASEKFECAIVTAATIVAGCHGSFPDSAPKVPGSGAPETKVKPNAIEVPANGPGHFVSVGDPQFHRFEGTTKVLPYGAPLNVGGFTCSVDESKGVTCASAAGHGFTVSDTAYQVW